VYAPWLLFAVPISRFVWAGVLGILLMPVACTDEGTPPADGPLLSLRALDASCTEVWLEVRLAAGVSPRTISLLRDSLPILTTTLRSTDTLVVDERLSPNRRYTYTLTQPGGLYTSPVSATMVTMDTTSHEFTWQVDTLGVTASSLNDVVIVNDTLAYAVGEIYLRDSSGALDPRRYNLARWNGTGWRIERLLYQGAPPVLRSIFAFADNDVWFDPWFHWNGRTYQEVPIDPIFMGIGVNKMWGSPDGRLYVVGNGGFIAERSPSGTWRRLESGTTLSMYDVFGSRNHLTAETEVLAVASNVFQNQGARILRIQDGQVTELPGAGLTWGVNALWFSAGRRYYVVGPGVHWKRDVLDSPWQRYPPAQVTSYFSEAVRGIDVNDVFVAGSFREVVHFNGVSWRSCSALMPGSPGGFAAISVRGRFVALVGSRSPHALLAVGRRN
jgi:hypothetical protein